MYLRGHVATDDGTPMPHDVMVERVCNARVRQQVYASFGGDFSMDLGTMTETYVDATGDGAALRNHSNNSPGGGIPRRELSNCELRATIAGFRSEIVSLVDLTPASSSVDVGSIVVHRTVKVKGMTTSAAYYLAPKEARRAYDKGLDAEKKGRFADARQDFSKAVEIYPKFTSAWFRLGFVSQKLEQTESARTAYTRATEIDGKFLPPYMSLASMAFDAQDWTQVLNLTNHVLDLDPLKYAKVSGYILDLDPLDFAQAYFYNSAANFMLGKIEDAERSGLKAERLDVRPRFPQLHLLLAEIFARKSDYTTAIIETKIYLDMLPHAKDADQVREQLAKLEKLNSVGAAGEKADPN
jgi:tetratricopeptide (TPR) repeat protein